MFTLKKNVRNYIVKNVSGTWAKEGKGDGMRAAVSNVIL